MERKYIVMMKIKMTVPYETKRLPTLAWMYCSGGLMRK